MKTRTGDPLDLRSFTYGIIAGLFIVVACFAGVSAIAGVKWQPVAMDRSGGK